MNLHDDLEAYALGALDPAEARAYEAHLGQCGACREGLASYAPVVHALRGLPVEAPGPLRAGTPNARWGAVSSTSGLGLLSDFGGSGAASSAAAGLKTLPHLGHLIALPCGGEAASFRLALQPGQVTRVSGMVVSRMEGWRGAGFG